MCPSARLGSLRNRAIVHSYPRVQVPAVQERMLKVEVLPKKLDEEVAAAMVAGFGGVLTKLTSAQAEYIGVSVDGPYKQESYKY